MVYNKGKKRKGRKDNMFSYYNPHPQGKRVRDCVKRALTLATGKDYLAIQRELNSLKKETGSTKFNDNKNWMLYVNKQGWQKISFPAVKGQPRINGHSFIESYPKGTYLLRMARHVATVKNGVLYDTWDSRDRCVYNAWKVEE